MYPKYQQVMNFEHQRHRTESVAYGHQVKEEHSVFTLSAQAT